MADIIYDRFLTGIFVGDYNMTGLQIHPPGTPQPAPFVMLVSGDYIPDQSGHDTLADGSITTYEVQDTSASPTYQAGGQPLTGSVSVVTPGGSLVSTGVWDAQDVTWYASTITNATGAIIYMSGGTAAADKRLIAFVDFGSLKSSSDGDFSITWNANGILHLRKA